MRPCLCLVCVRVDTDLRFAFIQREERRVSADASVPLCMFQHAKAGIYQLFSVHLRSKDSH